MNQISNDGQLGRLSQRFILTVIHVATLVDNHRFRENSKIQQTIEGFEESFSIISDNETISYSVFETTEDRESVSFMILLLPGQETVFTASIAIDVPFDVVKKTIKEAILDYPANILNK